MKPLSELLEGVEPKYKTEFINAGQFIDRASYDKMKQVAVELAKCVASIASSTGRGAEVYSAFDSVVWEANDTLTRAREIIGGESE